MRAKQRGIILFTVLLILGILAMLLLSQMQMMLLYYRFNNQLIKRHALLRLLESEAFLLIKKEQWQPACIRASDQANEVIEALKHNQGCELQFEQDSYLMLIENIGTLACVQAIIDNKLYSTQHWRISLMAKETRQVMQLRIAKLVDLIPCDSNNINIIRPGLLSWRYLQNVA